MPTRRSLLLAGGALLSGCVAAPGSSGTDASPASRTDERTTSDAGTPTSSPTPASTASPTPGPTVPVGEVAETDAFAVRVERPRVRKLVVEDSGLWQTLRVGGGQFLVVEVDVLEAPESFPLGVAVGGGAPRHTEWHVVGRADDGEHPGTDFAEFSGATLALPAPTRDGDASVVLEAGPGARWTLPGAVESALGAAPEFRIDDFAVRTGASPVETAFTVTNSGDRDGRFMAQVSLSSAKDVSDIVAFDVPAGETVTHVATPAVLRYGTGTATVTVHSVRDIEREVTLPTPTPESDG